MFLTVGDKIRHARQRYGLKQIAFESYGFSRNYISMIETKKRSLNENMLKTMYEAICELSNNEYQQEYSYDEFKKSPVDQANQWLEQNCNLEGALNQYELFNEIAKKYHQIDFLIQLEKILGDYYFKRGQLLLANEHLWTAIGYCLQLSQNPASLYERVGRNYIMLGQYQESIAALQLSLNCLSSNKGEEIHRIQYCLALAYMNDRKYEKSLEWIYPVLEQNKFLKTKAAGYLIKEAILKKQGYAEKGRAVLLEFIKNPCYEPYLSFAYHNLACSYKDSGLYSQALDTLNSALIHRKSDKGQAVTQCLLGEIYFKMGEYQKANELFLEVKDIILKQCTVEQKEATLEWGFELYWRNEEFQSILMLLDDIQQLVHQDILPHVVYINFQNRLYKTIMDEVLLQKKDLNEYRLLLNAIS